MILGTVKYQLTYSPLPAKPPPLSQKFVSALLSVVNIYQHTLPNYPLGVAMRSPYVALRTFVGPRGTFVDMRSPFAYMGRFLA